MTDTPACRRRRRAAKSCTMCRDRKIKCDRNQPCSNCVDREYDCHFQKHRRIQPPLTPNDTPTVSSHILNADPQHRHRVLRVEQPPAATPATLDLAASEVAVPREPRLLPLQSDGISLQHILQRVERLEAVQNQGSDAHQPSATPQSLPDTQVLMDKTEIIRIPLGIAPEVRTV